MALTAEVLADVAAQGIDPDAMEAAIGVVSLFNYVTRVAAASGIEFDYTSPLPAFEPDACRVPAPRPSWDSWPVADRRDFVRRPALRAAWQRWREPVLDSTQPLNLRGRQVLAAAAAAECCDRRRVEQLAVSPRTATEELLTTFSRRLSRHPWQTGPADLEELRTAGFAAVALLHAISVVAMQNADSRLALVLRLLDEPA